MKNPDLSFDDFDERHSPPPETVGFDGVSRRRFLGGVGALGAGAWLGSLGVPLNASAHPDKRLSFLPVAAGEADTISLPAGYNWQVLASWGDPLWSDAPAFDDATRGTAATQARALGDNNDGMDVFAHDGRLLLAVNNEYTNRGIIFGNRPDGKPQTDDDVRKGKLAHGVSVFEIQQRRGGRWRVVKDSPFNRRITPDTPMDITGPARGHALLKTAADPAATRALGTWNNCGNGRTPWGTYLACEENFNGYFSSSDPAFERTAEMKRYGVNIEDWGYGWRQVDERFDISRHPNEPNRAGYVVEIDPADPRSTPKKRTALGRFKHENAEVVIADNRRVVVYLGDDERGEFLYRFVSSGRYRRGGDNADLLADGKLYVAKFDDSGGGEWIQMTPRNTGMSRAEICVHTRLAASKVGATTMDRPEWVAANPHAPEVYCALTNNKNRGLKPNKGGDPMPVNGPNPRAENHYGQIVRLRPRRGNHAGRRFAWDLFVLAGHPAVHAGSLYGGSANINAANMFNSPDGLRFDSQGRLWIQTDGNYSNQGDFAGMGNNQMLLADPHSGEIRRFMVGPRECEVTGVTWSADRKTMFVGIQHPGEGGGSSRFPNGDVPRSSIIAIQRDDGGLMG